MPLDVTAQLKHGPTVTSILSSGEEDDPDRNGTQGGTGQCNTEVTNGQTLMVPMVHLQKGGLKHEPVYFRDALMLTLDRC